jgi:hypothetical protein
MIHALSIVAIQRVGAHAVSIEDAATNEYA